MTACSGTEVNAGAAPQFGDGLWGRTRTSEVGSHGGSKVMSEGSRSVLVNE